MNNTEKKMTFKDYAVVSSLLFGLFFGAGNLIFPLHLGQLAGHNWGPAALGFLVTGVLLPLLSVLAIAITRAKGVYDVGLPLGTGFALTFMVLIHATIGPLFGTPRTATVAYEVGLKPFLALLTLVFVVAFASPLGSTASAPVTVAYSNFSNALTNGFLEGYNTMDALAGLAFGVTVVTAIQQMGQKDPKSVSLVTAKSGFFSMGAVALIYLLLILLGAMSLGQFKLSPEGGTAFTQIVNAYAGPVGQAVLATLLTVTCLTTAVGLVAAFAQDFHNHFPKVSYHVWLFLSCLASFLTANFGLETIIAWSTPMLMFLYPLSMVLILLSVFSPLFKRDGVVYLTVVVCTVVPAFFDMIVAFPKVVSQSHVGLAVAGMRSYLPLASIGMSWAVPALVGLVVGLVLHFVRRSNLPELVED